MTVLDAHALGHPINSANELAHAFDAVVRFGTAPDGLPWLLCADRKDRLQHLRHAVLRSFDLSDWQRLPESIRKVLDEDVAQGLMGVHEADLTSTGVARRVYVSRRHARFVFGRSILSQILDEPLAARTAAPEDEPITTAAAGHEDGKPMSDELAARIEDRIRESGSSRRLLLDLEDGSAWVGTVAEEDRPLRRPSAPYRPVVFESFAALRGTVARLECGSERSRVPMADSAEYLRALERVGRSQSGGSVVFEVPRAAVFETLVQVCRHLGREHARGRVHADVTPSNLVLDPSEAVSIDSLSIQSGEIAAAATFAWAPPEQVVGRPLDARADVFSLGGMVVALAGGVRFGEEVVHVVPVGGTTARKVTLLKSTGVFIDVAHNGQSRAWQRSWQELLSRCVAYDIERRPADGSALADQLAELGERYPLSGTVELEGCFGALVPVVSGSSVSYARLAKDE